MGGDKGREERDIYLVANWHLFTTFVFMVTIMTTEQYAKDIYCKHSKTNTASQQRIRKMIKDNKPLPQVAK